MATVRYTAKVKDSRLLELPLEARALGLKPGEEVRITFEHGVAEIVRQFPANEGMLAALVGIAELNSAGIYSDSTDTQLLLNEASGGAMYGYDPAE